MDRQHGKRHVPSEEEGEEKDEHLFPVYSARSQQDMSAMVSALSQVMGATATATTQQDPLTTSHSSNAAADYRQSQAPQQDQGTWLPF